MISGVQWVKAEAGGFGGRVVKANYILGVPPVPGSCAPPPPCCEQRTARRRRSGLATDRRFPGDPGVTGNKPVSHRQQPSLRQLRPASEGGDSSNPVAGW